MVTRFYYKVYVADISYQCILGLDFLQKFNFTLDFEKNEIRTHGDRMHLLKSKYHIGSCSFVAFRIRCYNSAIIGIYRLWNLLVCGLLRPYRYAVTDFLDTVLKKGVLDICSFIH